MTKHTPGPWVEADGFTIYAARKEGPHAPVASCASSRTVTGAQRSANARLIAAAPDMLAALKRVVDLYTGGDAAAASAEDWDDAWQQARAAIGKAEGRADG